MVNRKTLRKWGVIVNDIHILALTDNGANQYNSLKDVNSNFLSFTITIGEISIAQVVLM